MAQRETLKLEQQVLPGQGTEQVGEGMVCLLSLHAHRTANTEQLGRIRARCPGTGVHRVSEGMGGEGQQQRVQWK